MAGQAAAIPFATPADWGAWLAANHATQTEVWLLYHKKGSGTPSVDWQEAVVEALCWGWIDGIRKSLNETQWIQRFTPRKPGSNWSRINRAHAERLVAEGRMQPSGLRHLKIAQDNGRWDAAYAGGKATEIPEDFLKALVDDPAAQATYQTLNAANRYAIYYRLTTAKRPETRAKRLENLVAVLSRGERIIP